MNVFITGGTGFIGRALALRLQRDGHHVTASSRNAAKAEALLGPAVQIVDTSTRDGLVATLEEADAVVNLAGEPILGGRWTDTRKRRIRESRAQRTDRLVDAMAETTVAPSVLVSGSAVGFYGDQGATELNESAPRGRGFLADVCADWEQAAQEASRIGTRVVTLRTGVVLGREGGALAQMLPPFRLGLGGPIGSGDQFVPWIHLDDLVDLIVFALGDASVKGPLNASAPNPVTFRELASSLGEALRRPALLPVPTVALRAIFGDAASTLTDSLRVLPAKAQESGFQFGFERLSDALEDILNNDFVSNRAATGSIPESAYLNAHPPAYLLESEVIIDAPLEEVFSFFSRPENLGLITPPGMQFRITSLPDEVRTDALIRYRLKVGPMPISWTTRIECWEEGARFVDSQLEGPYTSWWHEHTFEETEQGTRMRDRVYYTPPLGPIGKMANALYIQNELKRVFGYRAAIVRRRFGADSRTRPPASA